MVIQSYQNYLFPAVVARKKTYYKEIKEMNGPVVSQWNFINKNK